MHAALHHSSFVVPHNSSILVLIVLFAVLFRASTK
jgi:hypothetical protein